MASDKRCVKVIASWSNGQRAIFNGIPHGGAFTDEEAAKQMRDIFAKEIESHGHTVNVILACIPGGKQ